MYTCNNIRTEHLGLFEIGFIVDALQIFSNHTTTDGLYKYVKANAKHLGKDNYVIPISNLHKNKAKIFFSYVPSAGNVNIVRLELESAA